MKIMNIAGKGNDLHQEIFPVLLHYQSKNFFTELLIVLNIAKYYLFNNKFLKH